MDDFNSSALTSVTVNLAQELLKWYNLLQQLHGKIGGVSNSLQEAHVDDILG